eukprot:SAG31_NODE_301_length_18103_cov_13.772551_8_plen_81_part_00
MQRSIEEVQDPRVAVQASVGGGAVASCTTVDLARVRRQLQPRLRGAERRSRAALVHAAAGARGLAAERRFAARRYAATVW